MEPILTLEHVSRRFPMDHTSVSALDDVSLKVDAGEFLAVAGPSGSGKSTLLHLAGCLDTPNSGTVWVAGVDTGRLETTKLAELRRRRLGFIFQTFNLVPVFTAVENVEYPLILARRPAAERRQRALDALDSVGLAHRAGHRPDLLSGGERQRVAIARALVHRPSLVLADEPTANLDSRNAWDILSLCRTLNQRTGVTFLFATHDARLLEQADRVVVLRDGRIQEESHAAISSACV